VVGCVPGRRLAGSSFLLLGHSFLCCWLDQVIARHGLVLSRAT
jgi:hypothetical protein